MFWKQKKLLRILSIDGGGIRGIIPGQVLCALEKKLQQKTQNPQARLADYFDLMAGTSTGGILAGLYLLPGEDSQKAKYSAEQAVDMYLKRGHQIFDLSFWKRFKSADGLLDEKYPSHSIEKAAQEYFGEYELKDLMKPCLITAYSLGDRKPYFFTQINARKDPTRNYLMKDVARATSSAPAYFEPARIQPVGFNQYQTFIDGGVFAPSPSLCAYAEARSHKKRPTVKDLFIFSIGTGNFSEPYLYEKTKTWGVLQWIKPLIEILGTSGPEVVDFQLKMIFDSSHCNEQYIRIQPNFTDDSYQNIPSHAMDNVSPQNIEKLKLAGLETVEKNNEKLDRVVEFLL